MKYVVIRPARVWWHWHEEALHARPGDRVTLAALRRPRRDRNPRPGGDLHFVTNALPWQRDWWWTRHAPTLLRRVTTPTRFTADDE